MAFWPLSGFFFLSSIFFGMNASSDESGTFENGTPANYMLGRGNIYLKMVPDADPRGKSYFLFLDKDGQQKWLQNFSAAKKGCTYSAATQAPVALSATLGGVGYLEASNGYGLGVAGSKDGAGGCTQINQGEELSLDFRNGLGANEFLDFAELDMELKYSNTILTIQLFKDDVSVYTYTRTCTASDCGPDSTNNDNRRVRVPIWPDRVFFNRMVVRADTAGQQASATLEGGSDVYVATGKFDLSKDASIFHVATPGNKVVCGIDIPISSGETNATVNFFPAPGTECPKDKSYLLQANFDSIEVLLGGSDTQVYAIVTTQWAPETALNPVPTYSLASPPIPSEVEVWCNEFEPIMPLGPGSRTWCLLEKNIVPYGVGGMRVTEKHLLQGDATISKWGSGN